MFAWSKGGHPCTAFQTHGDTDAHADIYGDTPHIHVQTQTWIETQTYKDIWTHMGTITDSDTHGETQTHNTDTK